MHSEELGDYLGVESCTDFLPDVVEITSRGGSSTSRPRRSRRSHSAEYPPPIPMLAHTENLPSHMPWVMKKHRTSDGRLVITEERAPPHQHFQVNRSNGRLVLNLIPPDDAVEEKESRGGGGEEKLCLPRNVANSGGDFDGGDKRIAAAAPEEVYVGAEPCGGFGPAIAGMRPPVVT